MFITIRTMVSLMDLYWFWTLNNPIFHVATTRTQVTNP